MGKQLTKYARACFFIILIAGIVMVVGCKGGGGDGGGGGDTAPGPSGKVTQGAVSESVVYADHSSGAELNFKMDADEAETSTTSDDGGNFTMQAAPGFEYNMVAMGGTDTLTGDAAMFMLAPAGARNITPLTTLVALNPNIKTAIESLGVPYDADLTTTITPAAALFVQSIQATVKAATDAANPGGDSLSIEEINDIQRTVMTEIANEIQTQSPAPLVQANAASALSVEMVNQLKAEVATRLTNTASLTAMLTAALTRSLMTVTQQHSDITITNIPQVARQIAGPIVSAIESSIAQSTGTFTFSTTTVVAQNTIITTVVVSNIHTACRDVVGTISVSVTVVPRPNVPLVLSGTPATTAPVGVKYRFVPTVTDPDADSDCYLFSITNKPAWAHFNRATGALTGTPKLGDVGTTTGIVISVTDGKEQASLPAFDIKVFVPTGSAGGTRDY